MSQRNHEEKHKEYNKSIKHLQTQLTEHEVIDIGVKKYMFCMHESFQEKNLFLKKGINTEEKPINLGNVDKLFFSRNNIILEVTIVMWYQILKM